MIKKYGKVRVMSEVILDTLIDSIKLVPFLFLTYLAMEYLEHKAGEKTTHTVASQVFCLSVGSRQQHPTYMQAG